jgi:AcrR family transcriptional regulator
VLLFLFGSKDELIRALLARAREDELALLEAIPGGDPAAVAAAVWEWLAAPEHRPLLTLWVEAYGRSLVEPAGAWAGFARDTVRDWLRLVDPLTLAVLRGALLDLLATGDTARVSATVDRHLASLRGGDCA